MRSANKLILSYHCLIVIKEVIMANKVEKYKKKNPLPDVGRAMVIAPTFKGVTHHLTEVTRTNVSGIVE